MIDYMLGYFKSFFQNPSGSGTYLAIAVGLALGFGAVWVACYRPPVLRRPWLWAVLVSSAFLTVVAICFIQTPLQFWAHQALNHFWSDEILMNRILLTAIPLVLLTGLVQEGSKLVPVVIYWWRSGKNIDPKLGLVIGAMAGAGFGILEAQWAHNLMFANGWTWEFVDVYGFWALAGFWERFFTIAGHIAFSALAGYGLARGRGWQFYLIASGLHGLLNYGAALWQSGILSTAYTEVYVAGVAAAATGWALWLRWRKEKANANANANGQPIATSTS